MSNYVEHRYFGCLCISFCKVPFKVFCLFLLGCLPHCYWFVILFIFWVQILCHIEARIPSECKQQNLTGGDVCINNINDLLKRKVQSQAMHGFLSRSAILASSASNVCACDLTVARCRSLLQVPCLHSKARSSEGNQRGNVKRSLYDRSFFQWR